MGSLCNRSSHKDEEIIILKGDINDLRTKLEKANEEKTRAIEAEKREREENKERIKEIEEESEEKLKEKDTEVRQELKCVIEDKEEQIEQLNKKIIENDVEATNKMATIKTEYEDQMEEMRAVHESVVEEMEAEIKLSRLKAQDAKEKYERRMSKLHDDLRDVIEVAETSLADRTVCKDDAVGEIIWMVKKINSAGIEIPKPHERGVSSWQAYENVQFGLKGVFDNSEKTRANLFSEELLSGGDYEGVEEYVEEEEEEEDEVVNDDGTSLSSSEDEIIEGALRTLKSKSLKLKMASKRRNMFYENKKQETTEIDRRNWPQMEKMIPATNNNNSGDLNKAGQDEVLKELENLQSDYEKRVKYLEQLEEQYGEAMEERVVKLKKARQQLKDLHLEVVVPLYARHEATKIYGNRLKVLEDKINCTTAKQQLIERIENLEKLVKGMTL